MNSQTFRQRDALARICKREPHRWWLAPLLIVCVVVVWAAKAGGSL